ncbi:pseudo histidine-containing phosphotransfer protein 5-like isoform X3 [Salvia hispanica]|uniref:pseudo histidine-containing phosphotransfer protein 5-like isoform X3 n=1 Tax=Salvia hispanica TaxID=49212 RepID=UPI0020090163|nr:pseudo histidine-containing phosphotransfer protein 5-like isoform X3 [Salvia hispanica]
MERQAAYLRNALFDQGYLDEQFLQLEDLQDQANPHFVEEVVKLFYTDSVRLIQSIELTLIGAKKVKKECTQFQEYCNVGNVEGCIREFQEVKQEHAALKRKLENYFQVFHVVHLAREAR